MFACSSQRKEHLFSVGVDKICSTRVVMWLVVVYDRQVSSKESDIGGE